MTDAIDIVIPWVDGNDSVHRAERQKYTTGTNIGNLEDVGGDSRFSSIGEIFYCILSINVFAPFVRKIYIVTDRQDPHIEKPLSEALPEGHIPMEIIDHKVIFRGYEEYLPTFNSRAIETLIWRIPGLSERFLLMNDDFMFIDKVNPEDFFQEGKVICYAKMFPTWWARFMRMLRPERMGHKRISFKDSMLNAVDIMGGSKRFMFLGHTPRALKKSFFEVFFKEHEDLILRNIRNKFRNAEQFNSQELFYISEHRKGRCKVINTDKGLVYLNPKKKKGYIDRKLAMFERRKGAIFCCVNALCLADKEDQAKIMSWVRNRIFQNLRPSP